MNGLREVVARISRLAFLGTGDPNGRRRVHTPAPENTVMDIYDPTFVRAERMRRGWSIDELAGRGAIDAEYLADFERGLRWLPPAYAERLETALRTANVREVDYS